MNKFEFNFKPSDILIGPQNTAYVVQDIIITENGCHYYSLNKFHNIATYTKETDYVDANFRLIWSK